MVCTGASTIGDGVDGVVELRVRLEMGDVLDRARGQIVEREYFIAAREERFRQMRSDESRSTGNQHTHSQSHLS
jgi:hypothetical protein